MVDLAGGWDRLKRPTPNSSMRRFGEALAITWQVVFALMIRESRTRYGKSDIGYLWAILEPLIQLLILWAVFTFMMGRHPPVAASMPVFLITGILPFFLFRSSVARGASAASSNTPLLTYPQVKVLDVIIARVLLDAATTLVVALIFIVGLKFLYGEPFTSWIDHPLSGVMSLLGLLYFCMGVAVLSSGINRVFPPWQDIFGYVSRPLWITSGIFFTLDSLPHGARQYAKLNPVAHMLEWIRSACLPGFESDHYSVVFVLTFATICLFIGLFINWALFVAGFSDEAS